jgi:glycosyltransferase involved in cell wall biosynthesis
LASAYRANGVDVDIVRLMNGDSTESPAEVAHEHNDSSDIARTVEILNGYEQILIQHEFGIFDGQDGDEIIDILERLEIPVTVVLHTVLTNPSSHQREVMNHIVRKADALITMTQAGKAKLIANYPVATRKIHVIAHGARPINTSIASSKIKSEMRRPRILTWGLIGPGKGIEWAIDALAELKDEIPMPEYVIAGQTHPHVKLRNGENYRDSLVARINDHGIADSVTFIDHYLSERELDELITTADIVLLPYDSLEQVTSGVLVEALVAGVPIIATNFPHAREVLSDHGGILVKQKDPLAIALGIRAILGSKNRADAMRKRLHRKGQSFLWPAIGSKYLDIASELNGRKYSSSTKSLVS